MLVRRRFAAAALVVAGLAVALPAVATELREPKAHLVIDVPDDWKLSVDGDYVMASPEDNSFHLRIVGTDKGVAGEQQAEAEMLKRLAKSLDNIQISQHAKKIDARNYNGSEIFGSGTEHNGKPAKFFAIMVTDKKDSSKGAFLLGSGTDKGFERHEHGIHEAVHTLRSY
jgi:hypothetical protein